MECRALQWLSWARRVVGAPQLPLAASPGDAFGEVALQLAACPPYEVALRDVRLQLLHGQVAPQQLAYAVNGAVVGLVEGDTEGPSDAAPPVSEQVLAPAPCVGVGLVRAVDARQGLLYVLTDVPEAELERVRCLQVGRLELPLGLLQAGGLAPPYDSLFCLTATATGAGKMKSRNNLLRASLLGQG